MKESNFYKDYPYIRKGIKLKNNSLKGKGFFFSLIISLFIVIFLSGFIFSFFYWKISSLKDFLIEELETTIGFSIAYDSIDPHFLSRLKIKNVRLYEDLPQGKLDILSFESLEVSLDILSILGFKDSSFIRGVSLRDFQIFLDLSEEGQLKKIENIISLFSSEKKEEDNLGFSLFDGDENFNFYSDSVEIHLIIPKMGEILLRTENINLLIVEGKWDFTGFLNIFLDNSQVPFLSDFSSRINLNGFGKTFPWQLQMTVDLEDFSTKDFSIKEQIYFISMSEDYFRVLNTNGNVFNLDFLYDFKDKSFKGIVGANDWKIEDILILKDRDSFFLKDFLDYSLNIQAEVLFNESSGLLYQLKAFSLLKEGVPSFLQGFIDISLKGDRNWLNVENLIFRNNQGSEVSFKGDFSFIDFFPRGSLKFNFYDNTEKLNNLAGDLVFKENPSQDGYIISAPSIYLNEFSFNNLNIFLDKKDSLLHFKGNSSFLKERDGSLIFQGDYDYKDKLNISLKLEDFPVDKVFLALPKTMLEEALSLKETLAGVKAYMSFSTFLNINSIEESLMNHFDFSIKTSKAGETILVRARGEDNKIQILNLDLNLDDFFIKSKGEVELSSGLFIESFLEANLNNQKQINFSLDWDTQAKTISLTDKDDSLYFYLDYARGSYGYLNLDNFTLPLNKSLLTVDQYLSFNLSEKGDWLIDWQKGFISLDKGPIIPFWSLSWQAIMTKELISLEKIDLKDKVSSLEGKGTITDWLKGPQGAIYLLSESTNESLNLFLDKKGESLSLEVESKNLLLDHFESLKLPFSEGYFDIGLSLLLEDKQLISSLNFFLKDSYIKESPFEAEARMAFLDNNLISSFTSLQLADKRFLLDNLIINLNDNTYNFKGYLESIHAKTQKTTELSRWQSEGIWFLNQEGELDFSSSFLIDKIQQKSLKGRVLDFNLSKEDGIYRISSKDESKLNGIYNTKTGRISGFSSDPYPIRVKLEGFLLPDLLDIRIEDIRINVAELPLSILVPNVFAVKEGILEGNLFLSGTPSSPSFQGKLSASAVKMTTPYVGGLNLDGSPDEILIGPFEATGFAHENLIYLVGSNSGWVPSGDIDLFDPIQIKFDRDLADIKALFTMSGWDLDSFQLWLQTPTNKRGIPVAFNQAGIKGKGYALGSLILQVQGDMIDLKGDLTLNQVDLTMGSTEQQEKFTPSAKRKKEDPIVTADFNFTLGRSVRFLWPTDIFPIFRAVADNNQKVNLTFDGLNNDFSLIGDVNIKSGSLAYYSSSFNLTKGRIIFNENQDSFNPYIEVVAETRVNEVSSSGNTVDSPFARGNSSVKIFLTVNSLLSQMIENATLSSSPSRSQEEIMLLLGLGDISLSNLQRAEDLGVAGLNIASGLVTNVLFKPIEDFFRNSLNLDYFSLSSDWLKRLSTIWISEGSTGSGLDSNVRPTELNETVDVSSRTTMDILLDVLDNTRISAGKYIAHDVFFEGGFTISQGEQDYMGSNIQVNVDVGFELDASPFIIGWNIGLDLANLSTFNSLSNQITLGIVFTY